ncbi:acetyl-CoA hydrolase/transferase family protein [Variovorax sp. GB1P17]|uniref:acetyl-CoA hydrolase/transferase family protein n=1 Tax=Variovorax sp. GB1P17 TaxID=3443740 RepID=UPI003F46192C
MSAPTVVTAEDLDLTRWIRAGDTVWCGQGVAEPLTLTRALVSQAWRIGPSSAVLGMLNSTTFEDADPQFLRLQGYGGIGNARGLVDRGRLDVIPAHYSQLAPLVDAGILRCDVVLLQLSPAGPNGAYSLGVAHDHLALLASRARVVIAEINDQMPWTFGSEAAMSRIPLTAIVRTSRGLPTVSSAPVGHIEREIARHAAGFIGDRAVVQPGVGNVPNAILERLRDRKDLGIHAGLIGDAVLELMQAGAVTNAFKEIDIGRTTTGLAAGSAELYRQIHMNDRFVLRDPSHTHKHCALARLSRLHAVNSAVEVDLTGQINAEVAASSYVGAVGGQVDFARAALASAGGRSIIALGSRTRTGRSRIVVRLTDSAVTTPRSDADVIVTEWGAAQLRGQPIRARMQRMIDIAHPDDRERLAQEAQL